MLRLISGIKAGFAKCFGSKSTTAGPNLGRVHDKADEQLEQFSRLTGQVAHEIKNPLSTIKVNLKLIDEDLSDLSRQFPADEPRLVRAKRKLSIIQSESHRLEEILNGFLEYLDVSPARLADTDIDDLVGDMLDFYSPQANAFSVTVRYVPCAEKIICRVDRDMLKQVILNLFLNATQAMTGGGELMIRTEKRETRAIIQISDTGVGISSDRLGNIFDAYESSHRNGRGFGLTTVKKLVEKQKGSISIYSELGKGTCFTIELPLHNEEAA